MTDLPNISAQDQARILSEALPHMQRYDEETIVIKYGGHAMGGKPVSHEILHVTSVLLEQTAIDPVVVHGGGPQNARPCFTPWHQVKIRLEGCASRTPSSIEIVEMVLAGSINKQLVGFINEAGGKAVGLCIKDGNMVTAARGDAHHGRSRLSHRTVVDLGAGRP